MDKDIKFSIYYDFYKELLTEKQRELIELYYNNDFSLKEISENLGITRQGAHDGLKKAEVSLLRFEEKLKFVSYYRNTRKNFEAIYEKLKNNEDATCLVEKILAEE